MMCRLAFILCLLCLCVPAWADLRVCHATFNPAPGTMEFQDYGTAPLSAMPPEAKVAIWTTPNRMLWNVPPDARQAQRFANVAVNGGPNPLLDIDPNAEPRTIAPGTMLVLDGEGRDDAAIRTGAALIRQYGGSRVAFTTYALRMTLSDGAVQWLAESQYPWARSFAARRLQIRDIVDKQRVVMVELYPVEGQIDVQLRAMDFTVACLRRLYPGNKIAVISRGDIFPAGFTWPDYYAGKVKMRLMTDDERCRLAWYINSRFDICCVWGFRSMNVRFAEELVRPVGWNAEIR